MKGIVILGIGIGLIVLAAAFVIMGIVYKKTAGRRILEELEKEYGKR